MYLYPQVLFMAEQACRRRFCLFVEKRRAFSKMSVFDKHLQIDWYLQFMHFFENTK